MNQYRIFTDEDGFVFMAAKLDGDKVTILAETLDRIDALDAILEDAGFKVQIVEVDMDLGGKIYQPTPEDWID